MLIEKEKEEEEKDRENNRALAMSKLNDGNLIPRQFVQRFAPLQCCLEETKEYKNKIGTIHKSG